MGRQSHRRISRYWRKLLSKLAGIWRQVNCRKAFILSQRRSEIWVTYLYAPLWVLANADRVACEDTRVSGALLSHYGIKKPLIAYHDHNAEKVVPLLIENIQQGESVCLMSDAGMPLIADPGFKLVKSCRDANLDVQVIPGANAALTALSGSAIAVNAFYFAGFLPPKASAREKAILGLKAIDATLLFYEAPQRVAACLSDLARLLGPSRPAAVARELTKLFEETKIATLADCAEHFQHNPARGEFVIIVGAEAHKSKDVGDAFLDELMRRQLSSHTLRDAVAIVCLETGAKKAEIYERALRLKSELKP